MLVNKSIFLLLPILAHAMPRWHHWHHPSPSVDAVDGTPSPSPSPDLGGNLIADTNETGDAAEDDTEQVQQGNDQGNDVEALARTRTRTRTQSRSSTKLTGPTGSSKKTPHPSSTGITTSSGTSGPKPQPSDCKCGYVLSQHSNTYFPLSHSTSFSSLSGAVSQEDMSALGWEVTVQGGVGATSDDGTHAVGSIDALSGQDGALLLTVKGGQAKGGEVKVGEIAFKDPVTGGLFTMNAQLDSTPGTCQSIFTYHTGGGGGGDEQDIEVLGQTIFDSMDNGTPPGIQLTNYDPSGSGTNENTIVPFPSDPTTSFHDYTIAWLPEGTKYYFDSTYLKGPSKYTSENPSSVIINHWSAGIEGFTQGPPTSDVVMKVKGVTLYYQTAAQNGLPSGCSLSDACTV